MEGSQKELFEKFSKFLSDHMKGQRSAYANELMKRTLFAGLEIDWEALPPSPPDLDSTQEEIAALMAGYFRLLSMKVSSEECEYYFRRFPFRNLPISRADHLRNVCEMYCDRIWQFRDRLKALTKIMQKAKGVADLDYGYLIREFDRFFDEEIRWRNRTHHSQRFEYDIIEQMSLLNLLSTTGAAPPLLVERTIYQREARKWVQRIRARSKSLDVVIEHIATGVLEIPSITRLPTPQPRRRPRQPAA